MQTCFLKGDEQNDENHYKRRILFHFAKCDKAGCAGF